MDCPSRRRLWFRAMRMCSNSTKCSRVYPRVFLNRLSEEEISKWSSRPLHEPTVVDECSRSTTTKKTKTKKDLTCNTTIRKKLKPRMCLQNKVGNTSSVLKSLPIRRNINRFRKQTQISSLEYSDTAESKLASLRKNKTKTNVKRRSNQHFSNVSQDLINICAGEEIKTELEHFGNNITSFVHSDQPESSSDTISQNDADNICSTSNVCRLDNLSPVKIECGAEALPFDVEIKSDLDELKYQCEESLLNEDRKDITLFKSDELNSEIEVIREIENCWFEIANADPVNKKNQTFSRAEQIAALIDENKDLTIPIHSVIKFRDPRKGESSNDIKIIKEIKCCTKATKIMNIDKECGVEQLNCSSLGSSKRNEVVSHENSILGADNYDVRAHLLSLDTRKGSESRIEKICLLYPHYFNTNVKLLISAMVKTLDILFREFYGDNKSKDNQPGSFGLDDLHSEAFTNVLRKFSKQFVCLFQIIVNSFSDIHKPKMIPIIHLLLTKGMENISLSCVKPQYVWNTILRIFDVENVVKEYDILRNKNYEESKKVLSTYERWLEKYLVEENDSDLNKVHETSRNEDCVKDNNVPVADNNKPLHEFVSSGDLNTENNQNICRIETSRLEKPRIPIFETEELCLGECINNTCIKKTCVLCYYCKEPVCCEELCEVEDGQVLLRVTMEEYDLFLLTCKPHQDIAWDENYVEDWAVVEEHKMPYEPQCWRAGCGQRAALLCVCKTKAYCTSECQDADWSEVHHEQCSRQTDLELLLPVKST